MKILKFILKVEVPSIIGFMISAGIIVAIAEKDFEYLYVSLFFGTIGALYYLLLDFIETSKEMKVAKKFSNPNKFKINEKVMYVNKKLYSNLKYQKGFSLYGRIGKIKYLIKEGRIVPFCVEFKNQYPETLWCSEFDLISIDSLKFKKWIKG